MGNILVQMPIKKEQPIFESLLLRIENQATLDLFEFLNPHLILPGQKVLSNRILNNETESINKLRNEKLSNDQIGVILAFDGWKNASDISSERECMIEIIPKIEDLIKDAGVDLGAKVIAIISDSAAAYAGTTTSVRISSYYFLTTSASFKQAYKVLKNAMYCSTPKSVEIRTLCQSTPLKNVEKRVV
ncbi:hypothetical protein RhiirC2_791757 [Rhizophagus irregularis]|uniref:DUF659 domain-containing protein n=1 Tax=Rhizophagus irregularis TaxID=588596 RepID=A0A2N1MIL1_9GLOM|nr:hypothetical protein RhiirC2_791757 [Rhizophagus irregularis]